MRQTAELTGAEPMLWSTGTGEEVWSMLSAAERGDTAELRRLLDAKPELAQCQFHYRTPIYFAVRENRLEAARFLLERTVDPMGLAVGDSHFEVARDRGYEEMVALLAEFCPGPDAPGNGIAEAIRAHDRKELARLLDADRALLHAPDRYSNLPVHWAVMTRQPEILDDLLARGADLNAERADRARPIHLFNGDYHFRGWRDMPSDWPVTPRQMLREVIERGAIVDLNTACHMGDEGRVREILAADPGAANRASGYLTYYLGSGTPLRNAAACGYIEIVRMLLHAGADPNLPEPGIAPKGHALYSAVYNGHHEVAELLLEHGAYPSPPVESSADALSIAYSRKDDKMIDLLCRYGSARSVELLAYGNDFREAAAVFAANPALADDVGALGSAVGHAGGEFVSLMLRHAPRLPERFDFDGAPNSEIAELLFAHGMDANHRNWMGVCPMHRAASSGKLEAVDLLRRHGADINALDEDLRSTPLGWAAKHGQKEMAEYLLQLGARIRVDGQPEWASPIAWARRRSHDAIAQRLLDAALYEAAGIDHDPAETARLLAEGADPNEGEVAYHSPEGYDHTCLKLLLDSGRCTPDTLATMLGRKHDFHDLEGVRLLLTHGADPNFVTRWGRTAAQQATLRDNALEFFSELLRHGATIDAGLAARRGRADVLQLLTVAHAEIELDAGDGWAARCALDETPGPAPDDVEAAPLLTAFAGNGNAAGVARLLDAGFPVDARMEDGDPYWQLAPGATALLVAAWRARHETVALLLARGADPNAADTLGRTPLQLAVRACVDSYWMERRQMDSIRALLAAGARPDGIALPTGYPEADGVLRAATEA